MEATGKRANMLHSPGTRSLHQKQTEALKENGKNRSNCRRPAKYVGSTCVLGRRWYSNVMLHVRERNRERANPL